MAGDMVALAERFRGVTAARGQGDEDVLMDADTQSELIAMGIASPVTKARLRHLHSSFFVGGEGNRGGGALEGVD
eukprot:86504-Chlamydomonas_euryale.AAC.1